jgi:hypothetical protein
MPRLSITLSAVVLSMSLAPSAFAYATDPAPDAFHQIALVGDFDAQSALSTEACVIKVTPQLAEVIGLNPDWREDVAANGQTSMACADE